MATISSPTLHLSEWDQKTSCFGGFFALKEVRIFRSSSSGPRFRQGSTTGMNFRLSSRIPTRNTGRLQGCLQCSIVAHSHIAQSIYTALPGCLTSYGGCQRF